jgi:drug/metabolite transporter (DMT)-like permease
MNHIAVLTIHRARSKRMSFSSKNFRFLILLCDRFRRLGKARRNNMALEKQNNALKASWILLLATVFWGLSFLVMKAVGLTQQKLLPDGSSWFFASLSLVVRFGIASLLLFVWSWRTMRGTTRRELQQGIGLGVVGGIGLLFQMDAVNYTSASTAAFLTQCYCLFIPIFVACRKRCWPAKIVVLSCVMVVAGVAILSGFNWNELSFGRGEVEAIIASVFFTAQILWLERPVFSRNNMNHVSVIMFAVNLLSVLPIFFLVKPSWSDVAMVCSSTPVVVFYAILTAFCTLAAYLMMNYWQPHVEATRAGLIYCAEPIFASLFALFLPQWFSVFAAIQYANETLTTNLLIGGGLITAANVLILFKATYPQPQQQQERIGDQESALTRRNVAE